MSKIIEVENCFKCPYSTWKQEDMGLGSATVDWCFKANKEFEFLDEDENIMIEPWCPLKDKKE